MRIEHVLSDGLYQVTRSNLCAGFVIEHGRLTMCAPILRRQFAYWKYKATRIGPATQAGT